jgi:hypothetical protein
MQDAQAVWIADEPCGDSETSARKIRERTGRSSADQHTSWVFNAVLNAKEEGDGLFAIDHTVVIAEGQIHHGADDHLTIDGHRALLDAVHAEDGALWWIDDRGAQEGTIDAAVGDGEHTASEIADLELAVFGFFGVVEDVLLELSEGFLVAIFEYGTTSPRSVPTATPMS